MTGIHRLRGELADGTWSRRYGYLNDQPDYDGGFRLIIAGER